MQATGLSWIRKDAPRKLLNKKHNEWHLCINMQFKRCIRGTQTTVCQICLLFSIGAFNLWNVLPVSTTIFSWHALQIFAWIKCYNFIEILSHTCIYVFVIFFIDVQYLTIKFVLIFSYYKFQNSFSLSGIVYKLIKKFKRNIG